MPQPRTNIRVATAADAADIVAIYAPNVTDAIVSFELEVPTLDAMRGRIAETLLTHPWLVWEEDGKVVGYAYAGKHRERLAYQWSADVSCYVHPGARGRGVGKALYRELLRVLLGQGFVNAYAGIALPNDASVRLHESVGFEFLGVYRGVGFKQGEWRDVGWWHCRLGDAPANPKPPRPFAGLA
jgi:phosphinothricin acetyltransferase